MTDTQMLRDKIKSEGVSITFLAKKTGITRECFYQRLRNETDFRASEIVAIAQALHMTREQREAIFFGNNSD